MMISRREFMTALSIGVSSTARLPSFFEKIVGIRIGCQTNAWRIDPKDFSQVLSVLGKLKELGYDGFETGFRNIQGQFNSAASARAQIEKTGLQFFGAHIFLEQYDQETQIAPFDLIRKTAAGAASLGAQRLILSGGGLVKEGQVSFDLLKRKADGLNAAGKYCRQVGLRLAYHNHGPEFAAGGSEIEGLYRLTDPSLVDFLTDCGWAFRAKVNVIEFFQRHHRRIIGLHLRDFKGEEQTPLGQGDFPVSQLAGVIKQVNWQGWVLNEEERLSGEKPGEKAVAPARETLRRAFGK